MLTFLATGSHGEKIIGLGLSDENIRRLREGQPILLPLRQLLPDLSEDLDLVIFTGPTEAEMADRLVDLIGPATRVHRT
jgi:hypothetical protein